MHYVMTWVEGDMVREPRVVDWRTDSLFGSCIITIEVPSIDPHNDGELGVTEDMMTLERDD
jgi:hypothetical protein